MPTVTGKPSTTPVWDDLDLLVASGVLVASVKSFEFISRMIWNLDFKANTLNITKFGDDDALPYGLTLEYDGVALNDDPIKTNADFYQYGYDVAIANDEVGQKNRVLSARWTFEKYAPNGLAMWGEQTFGIRANGDMTGLTSVSGFTATLQGYV